MTTLKERAKEVAQKIVDLTGFGQALHVNDILPDLRELVRQELLALAEAAEHAQANGEAVSELIRSKADECV